MHLRSGRITASGAGSRARVAIVDPIARSAERRLVERVDAVRPAGPGSGALRAALAGASGAIVRTTPLPREVLEGAPDLRVIAKHGTGVDSIDLEYASERGIVVARAGGANAPAVAEFALAAILLTCKPILAGARWLSRGAPPGSLVVSAERAGLVGREISEQCVGIVGWGAIGRRVGAAVAALGGSVIAYDPAVQAVASHVQAGVRFADDLPSLLRESDVVTVHVPLLRETRSLVGAAELGLMRPGAAIVNTSRGGVVDELALADAIGRGHLRCAVVDVHEREPPRPDDPLLQLENVICTPHIAGITHEALRRMGDAAAGAVLDVLGGRTPRDVANPEVLDGLGLAPARPQPATEPTSGGLGATDGPRPAAGAGSGPGHRAAAGDLWLDRDRLRELWAVEEGRFCADHPQSMALHDRAATRMPLGVPMPWMLAWPGPCPVYARTASGSRVIDVDGNAYVDFCLGDTGAMTGHSPPAAIRRIRASLGHGLTLMLPHEDAIAVSEQLARRFGQPRWQYTLSATDANRHALRYARAVTGRQRVLIFDRCYHGTVDECFATLHGDEVVARDGGLGPPVAPSLTTTVVQFNDVDALERELATREIACVLTEPALTNIGIVLPDAGFHDALREATRRTGTLLVIDETHTISAGPGGWTGRHGLAPDMLVVGKPIASGLPGAALGMTDELDAHLRHVLDPARAGMAGVGGTLAANALSLAAIRATLDDVLTDRAFAHMDGLGARLEDGVSGVIARHRLPWHVARIGGRVEYHFSPAPLRNGAEGAQIVDSELSNFLHLFALNRGVIVFPFHNRALVSPVHSERDVDAHTEVLAAGVRALLGATA